MQYITNMSYMQKTTFSLVLLWLCRVVISSCFVLNIYFLYITDLLQHSLRLNRVTVSYTVNLFHPYLVVEESCIQGLWYVPPSHYSSLELTAIDLFAVFIFGSGSTFTLQQVCVNFLQSTFILLHLYPRKLFHFMVNSTVNKRW